MQKVLAVILGFFFGLLLVACSSGEKDNPYKEAHIVTVMPDYEITSDENPNLQQPLDEMTEEALKARYGELQKQSGLSTRQQKELNMIAERLRLLSKR